VRQRLRPAYQEKPYTPVGHGPHGVPDVLAQLEGVRRVGAGWVARCPAHPDQTPSLSIGLGEAGRVLLHCFAGCPFTQIVAALDRVPA
jgi:hypothetical protein